MHIRMIHAGGVQAYGIGLEMYPREMEQKLAVFGAFFVLDASMFRVSMATLSGFAVIACGFATSYKKFY